MTRFLREFPVRLLLLIPALLYLTVAIYWQARGIYSLTGDEPHYLLIADSLVRDRDLRVENNYQIDTPVQRAIELKLYVPELMPIHVRNQFSLHNIGLPLLLALPYAAAGVFGAKVLLALLAGLWPLLLYRVLLQITGSEAWSVALAVAIATGLPFAGASNQITPDLLAGMIVLYVAWRFFGRLDGTDEQPFSLASTLWLGVLIGFLPWLHIRLIAPAGLLLLAYIYTEARLPRAGKSPWASRPLVPVAVFVSSLVLLAIYNHIAFGSLSGPYEKGSLSFNPKEVCMIFFGLHWDQAQGAFMQQPLFLLGLVGIVPLFKANWRAGLLLGALYLSLIVPNSMHTAWYGGFSFAGRFGWTAWPLWVFPLAFTVRSLLREKIVLLKLLVISGMTLQLWLAVKWIFRDGFLIIPRVPVWATRSFYDDTGLLFVLPSFKDFDIYLKQAPNYVFVSLGILLVISGWLWQRAGKRLASVIWAASLAAGAAAIMLLPAPVGTLAFEPYKLPHRIGNNDGASRVATEKDGAGALTFGPYVKLLAGRYEVNVAYASTETGGLAPGRFDIMYSPGGRVVGDVELPPSNTNSGVFKYRFPVRDQQSLASLFEFRVWYLGRGSLKVESITIAPVSFDQ